MIILKIIMSFFAILGFGILYNAPKRELIWCGVTGAVSFTFYTVTNMFSNELVSIFVGTGSGMLVSRWLAYNRKVPSTVFIIMGILPLVPGAGIYYTMYGIINSDMVFSYMRFVETLKASGVIAISIILVFLLPSRIFRIKFRR